MAVQSTIYDLETTDIRFFLSTKPIASKSHVAIWIKGDDDIYRITNESEYELINDNIVFPTHPSGKALELRVGDTPSDLVQAPNDIAIVSSIAGEIVIVADSVQDVITVSDNITQVTIVSDNMTELLVISTNIGQVLLSKEYAVNPEDVAITGNPTDFSSLHHASKSKKSAEDAQDIVNSINFPAGLIMEWHTDRKPSGWLWCDGESYSVFSPTPAFAYDELYQVLVDPTYIMTTKPEDWDINYPDYPNGWYDPSFAGSVVTQAELDLTVETPDRRGLFVRGKDQAGSVLPARGIDTHGVVGFDTVIPSQNKAHTHTYSKWTTLGGGLYDTGGANNGQSTATSTESEGGSESNPTYGTTNYIIRAKGSYNGDGSGSGGTGVTPIASEIEYSDTHSTGNNNVQDVVDNILLDEAITKVDVGATIGDTIRYQVNTVTNTPTQGIAVIGDYTFYSGYNYFSKIHNATGAVTVLTSLVSLGGASYLFVNYSLGKMIVGGQNRFNVLDIDIETGDITNVVTIDNSTIGGLNCGRFMFLDATTLLINQSDYTAILVTIGTDNSYISNTAKLSSKNAVFISTLSNASICIEYSTGSIFTISHTPTTLGFTATGSFMTPAPSGSSATEGHNAFPDSDGTLAFAVNSLTDAILFTLDEQNDFEYSLSSSKTLVIEGSYKTNFTSCGYRNSYEAFGTSIINVRPNINLTNIDVNLRAYSYYAKSSVSSNGTGKGSISLNKGDGGANGQHSSTQGNNTLAPTDYQSAFGEWNIGNTDTLLEVGIGIDDANRANGLEVYATGDIKAPNRLDAPTDKSLITADNYGVATIGGTAKFRLDGTVLYIRTDGTDA